MNFARCSASSRLGLQPSYQRATSSSLCTIHRSRALAGPAGSSRRRRVSREFSVSAIGEVLQRASSQGGDDGASEMARAPVAALSTRPITQPEGTRSASSSTVIPVGPQMRHGRPAPPGYPHLHRAVRHRGHPPCPRAPRRHSGRRVAGAMTEMSAQWPALPYEGWRDTCDTLHAHTQVLGKLAAALAPPEPQLQHAALRLTARRWETPPLPAPDRSGALVVALA